MASTIKDVARLAGVSISTVSRVTNNAPNVSPDVRRRVQRAIKVLNYTPNIVARSLEARSMKNIAIVMGRTMDQAFSNPDFFEILQGITSTLSRQEYNSLLLTDSKQSVELEHCTRLIHSGAVQGVVVVGSFVHDPLLNHLVNGECPFVLIGYPSDYPDIYSTPYSTVSTNDKESAYQAVRFLLERGHRRIGLVHASLSYAANKRRYDGYIDAITEACLQVDHTLIAATNYEVADIVSAVVRLLNTTYPPTAIYCTDDYKATGVLRAALQMGMRVPEDLSVMGHNNYRISELTTPPLTTVTVPMFEMGRRAGEILLRKIADPEAPVENVFLPCGLTVRDTVKDIRKA